ncbi:MAG: phosphatase PAP2 family protein [Caldilineaceae bacterium]
MLTLVRTGLWYLHHWDVALSFALMLPEKAETRGGLSSEQAASAMAHLGDSALWFPLLLLAWAIERRRGGVHRRALEGWLLTIAVVAALVLGVKAAVRRPRPRRAGPGLAGPGPDVYSFPSGHAARMAASAVWASSIAPLGWLLWPLALVVGWSRIRLGIHMVGDVAAGWGLGIVVAKLLRQRYGTGSLPPTPPLHGAPEPTP